MLFSFAIIWRVWHSKIQNPYVYPKVDQIHSSVTVILQNSVFADGEDCEGQVENISRLKWPKIKTDRGRSKEFPSVPRLMCRKL